MMRSVFNFLTAAAFIAVSFTGLAAAQYGEVGNLGSGNAAVYIAAFDGAASASFNGTSQGRTGGGKVSDVKKVSAGNVTFSGGGGSVSKSLTAGKSYVVAYSGGRPVGVFELTNAAASRSKATLVVLNASGSSQSLSANGAGQGSVGNGAAKTLELTASRTQLDAGGVSASGISLRRGRVVIALVTSGGIATAN